MSIKNDPSRVATYDRLARPLRRDKRDLDSADEVLDAMMEANPKSALAPVTRYRYHREFGREAEKAQHSLGGYIYQGLVTLANAPEPSTLAIAGWGPWASSDTPGGEADRPGSESPGRNHDRQHTDPTNEPVTPPASRAFFMGCPPSLDQNHLLDSESVRLGWKKEPAVASL